MMTSSIRETQKRPAGGSGEMFDGIAERYDLLNRMISLGIDQSWRRRTVDSLRLSSRSQALDLATGTADLGMMIAKRVPGCRVIGVDPSEKMLEVGKHKVFRAQLSDQVELLRGDAQELPFEENSFDGTTIAFGIRNVPDRRRGLQEMARVTRPGGRVTILELSEPQGGILGPLARFHVHHLVPWLGGLLSGKDEYRYLQKSIAAFPSASDFARLMSESGLDVVEVVPLTFGVAHLYVATPRV